MDGTPVGIDELSAAVEADPHNQSRRAELVEALIADHEFEIAGQHFAVLVEGDPDKAWVLELGARLYAEAGDHLRSAHYRRALRSAVDDDIPLPPDLWDPRLHPSHASHGEPRDGAHLTPLPTSTRRLRLLPGGVDADVVQAVAPQHHLSDITGLATIKRHLTELIEDAKATTELKPGPWLGGVLLYGPKNSGKAFCVEVVAAELDAQIWTFDLSHEWDASTLESGVTRAIESAANQRVVLFFENVDALNPERRKVIARAVLPLLDEARTKGQVLIFAAATFPWQVSNEVVRNGRLGSVLLVLPPDPPSRASYLREQFNERDVSVPDEEIEWLVGRTEGHSFGDLEHLVDVAIDVARETAQSDDNASPRDISHAALRKARQGAFATSAEWLSTAGHHAIMNEGGGLYDDLLEYFRQRQKN